MTTPRRRAPYKGLVPYTEEDTEYFFGRTRDIRVIEAGLFASPLTLVYGPSGVGKTSILQAGVLERLRHREEVLVVVIREWREGATARTKHALQRAAEAAGQPLEIAERRSLAEHVTQCVKQLERRPMFILDQFESYFLYPENRDFAREFPAAMATDLPVSFLISIREDAVATLDRFVKDLPGRFDTYFRVEQLDRRGAEEAITEPLTIWNTKYPDRQVVPHKDLVEAVLNEMGPLSVPRAGTSRERERYETPFLQVMLMDLWKETRKRRLKELTPATLAVLGGGKTVIARHVASAMRRLNVQEQDVAAQIFQFLITPSGVKIAYTAGDLAAIAGLPVAHVTPVLEKLSAGGVAILRPGPPPPDQPTEPRYEVFHDILAKPLLSWAPLTGRGATLAAVEPNVPRAEGDQADGVFGAAGVKFLAVVGALEGFAEHPVRPVKRWMQVGGTGGGAIVAALLACDFDVARIHSLLMETNLASFRDSRLPRALSVFSLLRRGGLASGKSFEAWLDRELGGATFGDVHLTETGCRLRLIAADVTLGKMLVLPDDLSRYKTPRPGPRPGYQQINPSKYPIAKAVRMSMSIPFFFEPVELVHGRTNRPSMILDGGLFYELPVWLFDNPIREAFWPTFGIQAVSRGGKTGMERVIRALKPLALAHNIFRTTSEVSDKRFMSQPTARRTCIVDVGTVATTEFELELATVEALIEKGRDAAREYLDSFDEHTYRNVFGRTLRKDAEAERDAEGRAAAPQPTRS